MPNIEHINIAERKCKVTGRVHKIEGIQPVSGGFRQVVFLHIPELTDQLSGRTIRKEQYLRVEIFSKEQTDKRFLDSRHMRELRCCSVYVNSWHWTDPKHGLTSAIRLNFIEWHKIEKQ